MPLIECPNCKNKISDTTSRCIHCDTSIVVCPECRTVFAENKKVCTTCGYVITKEVNSSKISTSEIPNEQLNSPPKTQDDVVKSNQDIPDLHTALKEYKVYNSEYKVVVKLIDVLSVIFFVIPLALVVPFLAQVFVIFVRETHSLSAASFSMQLVSEVSENIWSTAWEFFGIAFNLKKGSFPILPMITFVISSTTNFIIAKGGIVAFIKDEIVLAKARRLHFDRQKTLERLKSSNENQIANIVNFEETQVETPVWYYFLREYDGMEVVARVINLILSIVLLFIPIIYSVAYCIISEITTKNVGLYATIVIVFVYAFKFTVSGIFSKMQTKRKEKIIKKYEKI